MSGAGLLSLLFSTIALLFYAISLGTSYWAEAQVPLNSHGINMGLFKLCYTRCEPYVDDYFLNVESDLNMSSRTDACCAFVIISIILSTVGIIQIIFALGREGYNPVINRAKMCLSVSGVCGFLAMIIWIASINAVNFRFPDQKYVYAYSFALEVTAWVVNLVACLLLHIDEGSVVYLLPTAVKRGGQGLI